MNKEAAELVGVIIALLVVLVFLFAVVPIKSALLILVAAVGGVAIALPLIAGSKWCAKKLLCHPNAEQVEE